MRGPIDVSIAPGEILAICGDSGAGKTTLLRCLALLEHRAMGGVRFLGRLVGNRDVPRFRRSVIYVPQVPAKFPLSVRESFSRAEKLRVASNRYCREYADELLKQLRLPDDILDREIDDLSVGEAQRVALVRAMIFDPKVLLLDEPTAPLDNNARIALVDLVGEWCRQAGRAIVFVSHDQEVVDTLATRCLRLACGTQVSGPVT